MLSNMVTAAELKDDEEYGDILEDVKEEAGKHGTVISVEIPRPDAGGNPSAVGKVRACACMDGVDVACRFRF